MIKPLTCSVRDVGIFLSVTNLTDYFKDYLSQLLIALLIVSINSVIIPLIKYYINKIKKKLPEEIKDIFDNAKEDIINELENQSEKLKDKNKVQ